MSVVLLYVLICGAIDFSIAQNNANKVWILLDDTSVFTCRGVNNRFQISEKDVTIRNSQGRQVHYLEAPGTYVLSFNNIRVDQPLPNLSGQIKGVLQVPMISGPVLNWDLPYQLIPEKNLLLGGYKCDKGSGYVQDEGQPFCRYCDLCTTSQQVDQVLNKGHKFLPNVGSSDEPDFDKICTQIEERSYSIHRTINLPDKQELEREANAQFTGVGGELKKKLNKGKGKLQMELQVISSNQDQLDKQTAFQQSGTCRCCLPNVNDFSCRVPGFLGGGCNQDSCMSQYAQQCIRGAADKVGCYSVQFNYQVTDKPEDVRTFLQKNHYRDEYNDFGGGGAGGGNNGGSNSGGSSSGGINSGGSNNGGSSGGNGNSQTSTVQQSRCINAIQEDRFKRYCEARWQQNFCCSRCNGNC